MKVISIWQPWATLVILRMKFFETRTWPAPQSVIGQTIGIAATKNIIPAQRDAYNDPKFQFFYEMTGLPPMEELPRGVLLGTVLLDSVELIDEDFIDQITLEEQAFGYHMPGNYAWRIRNPRPLAAPVPIRGAQGLYDWKGLDNAPEAAFGLPAGETAQGGLPGASLSSGPRANPEKRLGRHLYQVV